MLDPIWSAAADELDRWYAALPSRVFALLALSRGRLGRPGEHFLVEDERIPPVFTYHRWLIDDLSIAPDRAQTLHSGLSVAALFLFAGNDLGRLLIDRAPSIGIEQLRAIPLLMREADLSLMRVLPPEAPLWRVIRRLDAEAVEPDIAWRVPPGACFSTAQAGAGQAWAPMIALSIAALHGTALEHRAARVAALIAAINAAHQLRADLLGLAQDARDGVRSLVLDELHRETGLPRDAGPEQALGALATSGVADTVIDAALAHAASASDLAQELALASFARHVEELRASLETTRTLFQATLRATARLASLGGSATVARRTGRLDDTIARAADFLRADPDMREAWDVYRTGFLGEPVRTGKPYPMGFVLENMAACGIEVSDAIERVLAIYRANDGDYFDGPVRLPRDIDTAGLMLRLYARVKGGESDDGDLDRVLRAPLAHLAAAVRKGSGLPVWVTQTAPIGAETQLLGMSCTSSQVNLLLGVARLNDPVLAPLLDDGCRYLAGVLEQFGSGRSCFYGPRYLVWLLSELAGIAGHPKTALAPHAHRLRALEAQRAVGSPQDAALLLMAGADREAGGAARDWMATILAAQRPDGGWAAEDLYWAPTPQQLGYWYASRAATTSLCLRALHEGRKRGVHD